MPHSHFISDSGERSCEGICKKNGKNNICTQGINNDRINCKITRRKEGSGGWSIYLMDYEQTNELFAKCIW
jgi:hypothetical protein